MLEELRNTVAGMVNQRTDALVLVDIQEDFLPGGALAVPEGGAILPVVQAIAPFFNNIIVTQDWHPEGHSSFASAHEGKTPFETFEADYGTQVLWPDHCVMGTEGAKLRIDPYTAQRTQMTVRKGFRPGIDSYSAFMENDKKTLTGLGGFLRDRGLSRVFFAGLATDYCVGFSALDARALGFEAVLIEEACRGIAPDTIAQRMQEMRDAGVVVT